MKIISFNVNGIRAIVSKNFIQDMQAISPDVICLQETKADAEQVAIAVADLSGYHVFANAADKKGYSGTAILSKVAPLSIQYDMGIDEHDHEGRIVCAEYNDFFLVCVYVPNSGSELARLPYRQQWDADFLTYLKKCEETKPVVICGDLNVAHQAIDLARLAVMSSSSQENLEQYIRDNLSVFNKSINKCRRNIIFINVINYALNILSPNFDFLCCNFCIFLSIKGSVYL